MARPSRRYIEELAQTWEPRMRDSFLRSVADIANRVNVSALARLLESGDIEGALRAVGLDPGDFTPLALDQARVFAEGGITTAQVIPTPRTQEGFKLSIRFDVRAPRAEAWLSDNSSRLIGEIVTDQEVMIRRHLTEGLARGQNPRQTALDLVGRINRATNQRQGGVIGLHSTQERWVAAYVQDLESADPATLKRLLDRGLRDKRFDRSVLKAIREGTGLPAELQAKMRTAYSNRALRWRGENIAREETLKALRAGQIESWDQGIDKGVVEQEELRKFWHTAGDERVRPDHRLIPGMNPDGRAWAEPFETPTGPSMFAPHDHDIGCRCRMEVRVDHIGRAVDALAGVAA